MPTNRHNTPADVRPTLLFWVAVTSVLAVFGVGSSIALMVVDANYVDLPNPMVTFASVFGATATVVCVVLGMAHLLRVSGVDNTRAAVAAVLDARRDIKEDTGEIHGLRADARHPEIIVVRESVRHVDQVDRERAMRVLHRAEAQRAEVDAEAAEVEYAERYREMTHAEVPTRPRLVT